MQLPDHQEAQVVQLAERFVSRWWLSCIPRKLIGLLAVAGLATNESEGTNPRKQSGFS